MDHGAEEGAVALTHLIRVLSDVASMEFVLLAALTVRHWVRHRTRGAGWLASAFAALGGLTIALQVVDPTTAYDQIAAKALTALLLSVAYCLFRFARTCRPPGRAMRSFAGVPTALLIAVTLAVGPSPQRGPSLAAHGFACRAAIAVVFGFVCAEVVVRLWRAGRGAPLIASARIRLFALAVAGLLVEVVVGSLGLDAVGTAVAGEALHVLVGIAFLVALGLPSVVRVCLARRAGDPFRRAMSDLVSLADSADVAERILPDVCALVGASEAVLLAKGGTVVARHRPRTTPGPRLAKRRGTRSTGDLSRITVRVGLGSTHALATTISPAMTHFGREELTELHQLAGLFGLAMARCEVAATLAFQASHDGLTGLANRSSFMERLEEALPHVGRRRTLLSVIFIDLDRFKLVNDEADHAAGDVVLRAMAERLGALTRDVDVVARFGGDEFVIFAEVDHEQDALDVAQRVRTGLRQPIDVGRAHLIVTASIGLAVTADASSTASELLRDADNAMYEAKRAGRDRIAYVRASARLAAHEERGLDPVAAPSVSAA